MRKRSVPLRRVRQPGILPSYLSAASAFLLCALTVAAFTGQWPWVRYNPYNSYTLQAQAWLQGRLDLGRDYDWLELAIYHGKYYVSFPPFPSMLLLPFAAIFGESTPDALLAWAAALWGLWHALSLARSLTDGKRAAERALYLLLANGYVFLCLNGYVWFFAQNLAFALSLAAISHALQGRGGRSLFFWACAVGCRPMTLLCAPVLLCLLRQAEGLSWKALILRRWSWLVAPALIGGVYAWLNFARFGNPLEFGHNWLPEFVNAEHGQFSLAYLLPNLRQLLMPPQLLANGRVFFDTYDAQPVYLSCPLLISCVITRLKSGRGGMRWLLPATIAAYLLIICCHKTLGSWQFGARYLVDLLPWAYLGTLLREPDGEAMWRHSMPLFLYGVAFHLIGTVITYLGA